MRLNNVKLHNNKIPFLDANIEKFVYSKKYYNFAV